MNCFNFAERVKEDTLPSAIKAYGFWDFPSGSLVKIAPVLPMQGAQVQTMVGELRFCNATWHGQKYIYTYIYSIMF